MATSRILSGMRSLTWAVLLILAMLAPLQAQVTARVDRECRDYAQWVESRWPVVNDPAQVERVGRIVARLYNAFNTPGYNWRFRIIANPVPNAFALPNGYIYIHQGLLDGMPGAPLTDDEIAFVLAHEMTHVVLNHAGRSEGVSTAMHRISVRSGVVTSTATALASMLLRNTLQAGFSREMETEADHQAVIFVSVAGYDPHAALGFFARMEAYELSHGQTLRIFHTHPKTADRYANVRKWIGTQPVSAIGTLDGMPRMELPVTLVAVLDRGAVVDLTPPEGTDATGSAVPAVASPSPRVGTVKSDIPMVVDAPQVPSPTSARPLEIAAVAPHLQPLLTRTNLVTVSDRGDRLDSAMVSQMVGTRKADALLVLIPDRVQQDSMPWPDGVVYSVDLQLTAVLIDPRDGHLLHSQTVSASGRATLGNASGQTRASVFEEVVDRALRKLDTPLNTVLKGLAVTRPPVPAP